MMEQMNILTETPFMTIEKLAEKPGVEKGVLLGWVKKSQDSDRQVWPPLKDLAPHFTGLWKYSPNNFRLDCTKTYIDFNRLYKSSNDDCEPLERSI